MKNKRNYLIILIYGLLLTFFLLGLNNVYGSTVDWTTQHTIFPNYFRNMFYETKNLLPNLAINIGSGQNIFNFSYYGLMSPIILLSYFFPFLSMDIYIMIMSIILHISSGLLLYKFLIKHTDSKISLILSLIFLSLSPLTYHFHYHLMFVWYFPFLILSFIGVDRYIEKQKSFLLIISIFLILLTNYYYGVTSTLVITIYGIYSLLDKYINLKEFFINIFKASIRIIIPILLCFFILLPSLYTILRAERSDITEITLSSLFIFNIKESMYHSFTVGISFLFLASIISIVVTKNKTKKEIFLNTILFFVTFIPIFMYILNGFLYVRGKILIPFVMLYMVSLVNFIKRLKNNEINIEYLLILISLILVFTIFTNFKNNYLMIFVIDTIITIVSILILKKYKKIEIILIPAFIIILYSSIINNIDAKYLSLKDYTKIKNNDKTIEELFDYIDDDSFYRTDTNINESINMNKIYTNKHYSTSLYSSSYNSLYNTFYNEKIGNNIVHRNHLMTSGMYNPLFSEMMGIKYIITKSDAPLNYKKINKIDDYNLYKNENVLPLIYIKEDYGSLTDYENLSFPYNIEYMLNNSVTNSNSNINYNSNIKKLEVNVQKEYKLTFDKKKKITYSLDKTIDNSYLMIKFDMNYNHSCSFGDVSITINNVKNKLTCKEWRYHNKNYTFEYVISSNEEIKNLQIEFTKGTYFITNIEVYLMPKINYNYKEVGNLKLDKGKSIITGTVNVSNDSYVITSLPFDDGYNVYVDGKKTNKELVNTAFLGLKIGKGNHTIKIVYQSPWYICGIIISGIGLLGFIFLILFENRTFRELLIKYKEIISYLVFGGLTTIVSLGVYYILTNTILNPYNNIELQISNIVSWIISVTFAYITNKKYVFKSKDRKIKEMISFYTSRLVTLFIDMIIMFIFVSILNFDDTIIKIISQIIIIILNYILSKFLVFKEVKNG